MYNSLIIEQVGLMLILVYDSLYSLSTISILLIYMLLSSSHIFTVSLLMGWFS